MGCAEVRTLALPKTKLRTPVTALMGITVVLLISSVWLRGIRAEAPPRPADEPLIKTGFVEPMQILASGGALLAPSVTRRLIRRFAQRRAIDGKMSTRLERLTQRERDVLAAIARGLNNAEISKELFIGAATVKTHVSSILAKLGLRDRAQAVVFAYESGLAEAGGHDIGH